MEKICSNINTKWRINDGEKEKNPLTNQCTKSIRENINSKKKTNRDRKKRIKRTVDQ
jgi:hypothetical protein